MFDESVREFLFKEMCIDVDSIENKSNESFLVKYRDDLICFIERYVAIVKSLNGNPKQARAEITSCFCSLSIDDEDVRDVFDTIRHVFENFSNGGILQLYRNQENEYWYPKIIIRDKLPSDHFTFTPCEEITVYRGCSREELDTGSFGQAWSTSYEVAKEFAYVKYAQSNFIDQTKRVVLKTVITIDDVLGFFAKESEVVVKVGSVKNNFVEIVC